MEYIKKHFKGLIAIAILLALFIYHKDSFFLIVLIFSLFIYTITREFISTKLNKILSIVVWSIFAVTLISAFYINRYLPHGTYYETGTNVCEYRDSGPCGEEMKEDINEANIPQWAKLIRSNYEAILIGAIIAGVALSVKNKKSEGDELI